MPTLSYISCGDTNSILSGSTMLLIRASRGLSNTVPT